MTDRRAHLVEHYLALGFSPQAAGDAADYEIAEDVPMLAASALYALCWEHIDAHGRPEALSNLPVAQRLASAGAPADELKLLARAVAYEATFNLLYLLDEGPNFALRDITHRWDLEFPGWTLVETDADGEPTGRVLSGVIHEGLQTADPSGREALDLFE